MFKEKKMLFKKWCLILTPQLQNVPQYYVPKDPVTAWELSGRDRLVFVPQRRGQKLDVIM